MIQAAATESLWGRTAIEGSSERIILLQHDKSRDALDNLRETVADHGGQFVFLNLAEPTAESFPEMFYDALHNTCGEPFQQFSLPIIVQHHPHVESSFINRAILWQRLCNRLIMDDTPYRKTILVLESVDQASHLTQHEIARLIRFHEFHSISRTFVFTLNRHSHAPIIPELQEIFDKTKNSVAIVKIAV